MNLLFDYDGTIHNSAVIYKPAFKRAYEYLLANDLIEAKEVTDATIEKWIGFNSVEMWDSFAPELSEEIKQAGNKMIGDAMCDLIFQGKAELYSGAQQSLEQLIEEKHTLLLLSNCSIRYMQAHREYFGLEKYFADIYCAEKYNWSPKSTIFETICKEHPGEYIVIGDRYHDFDIAKTHGLKFIGCTYGYGEEEELADSTAKAMKVVDIPDIVSSFKG